MKFDQIKELKDEKLRRLTGVRERTFSKMVDILRKADSLKKSKGGRKNKLNLEEQLLMALEYSNNVGNRYNQINFITCSTAMLISLN
ncbi:putative transposase [Orientia tsutsugamushi str. Gilliam]|uniref:IS5 family transposase ISOt6 n=1 Tax=Orientia tsutsugamushi str. Gilliam TaxID=1359184 RepID=A0A0F3MEJ3_ORITS|nr:putative transposase [Orientia tsutsugamushi str. Gilliam]SPR02188.1 IS5 family transposase ISOt6 [Orientia tsutsugamushi str. Gilliam]